jgi:transposase
MSKKKANGILVINTTATGIDIDIDSQFHVVAVTTALCDDPVKRFQAFTTDLHNMVAWLV